MPLAVTQLSSFGASVFRWTPASSSECVWWHRAEDLATGAVQTWGNKIVGSSFGNLTDGGVTARRPTCLASQVNGKKAVQFDGSQNVLQSSVATSVPQAYHTFMVFTVDTWSNGRVPINLNNTVNVVYLIMPSGQTNKLTMTANGGSNFIQHSQDWTPGTYYLAHNVYNGASSGFAQNNVAAETGNVGTGAMDRVTLGAMAPGNAHCAIRVAELFGFDAEQSGTALDQALNYVSEEYALW